MKQFFMNTTDKGKNQKKNGKFMIAAMAILLSSSLFASCMNKPNPDANNLKLSENESNVQPTSPAEKAEIIASSEDDKRAEESNVSLAENKQAEESNLSQEELVSLKNLAETFSAAFFTGDTATLKKYLVKDFEYKIEVYDKTDRWDKVIVNAIKGLDNFKENDLSGTISVEYWEAEFDDSFTYLTIELRKENADWKVSSYGLEK